MVILNIMEVLNNTAFLVLILLTALGGAWHTADRAGAMTNLLPSTEQSMRGPVSFGLIVLLQGLFGGQGFTDTPHKLKNLFKYDIIKFVALYMIAFSGTQDIEEAFFVLLAFLTLMQLIRTPEERKNHPYLI
tara:strand:+ start:146 stop:541 length:396 start_codon:yes stop_codon:yes gene_type:complete